MRTIQIEEQLFLYGERDCIIINNLFESVISLIVFGLNLIGVVECLVNGVIYGFECFL
jgi:hypothetical protein